MLIIAKTHILNLSKITKFYVSQCRCYTFNPLILLYYLSAYTTYEWSVMALQSVEAEIEHLFEQYDKY